MPATAEEIGRPHPTVEAGEPVSTWKERLQARFPDELIAYKPKVSCRNCTEQQKQRKDNTATCDRHEMAECELCGNWITTGHVDIPYVGHADVTRRLNWAVDEWSWAPVATAPDREVLLAAAASGNPDLVAEILDKAAPAIDANNGMWITLTIVDDAGDAHVKRGYGDAQGKVGADAMKEIIGDAIRNAGQRFGIAAYLWSRADMLATGRKAAGDEELVAGPGRRGGRAPKPAKGRRVAGGKKTAAAASSGSGGNPAKPLPADPTEELVNDQGKAVPAGVADLARLMWDMAPKRATTFEDMQKKYESAARSRWLRQPARPPWEPAAAPIALIDVMKAAKRRWEETHPDAAAQAKAGEENQAAS